MILSGRLRAVVIAPVAMALILSLAAPAPTAAGEPPGLKRFMTAVGKVESGGRYTAKNPVTGAYGKYQIMPASWAGWARQYLGNSHAPRTPANQERVARAKMISLYRWLGSWRRVAHWWLTGSARTTGWSASATKYVSRVMRVYQTGSTHSSAATRARLARFADASRSIHYAGRWATAGFGAYAGGKVHWSKQAGASATFTFTGRRIEWFGPLGPTRGRARVSVDGKVVRVVDLHRGSFDARALVFSKAWSKSGRHTLTIEVLGTRGHPLVAIDELVVRR